MGIIIALLSSFVLALSQVSLKRSFTQIPPSVAFFFDVIFALFLWIPFAFWVGIDRLYLPQVIGVAVFSAILSEAYYFFILSKGELSITATLLASYPVYTVLFSLWINNESPTPMQWLFIAITILGTLIITLPGVEVFDKSELRKAPTILWALSGAIAVGLADALAKNVIDRSSTATFLFALAIIQIPIALGYLRIEKGRLKQFAYIVSEFSLYKFAIIGSALNVLGVMLLFIAFQSTLASIAAPLTGTYPVIVAILARLFLREKLSSTKLIGVIIVTIGVLGLGVTS